MQSLSWCEPKKKSVAAGADEEMEAEGTNHSCRFGEKSRSKLDLVCVSTVVVAAFEAMPAPANPELT